METNEPTEISDVLNNIKGFCEHNGEVHYRSKSDNKYYCLLDEKRCGYAEQYKHQLLCKYRKQPEVKK